MKNRLKQRQRQQRSIWKMETSFKKGEKVLHTITGVAGEFVDYVESPRGYCLVDFGLCDLGLVLVEDISHATPAEIAAGHRIDQPELEVLDLADVGPNTKVSEL